MSHLYEILTLVCNYSKMILQSLYQSIISSYLIRILVTVNEKLVSTYTISPRLLYSNASEICLRPATLIHLQRSHV